MLRAPSKWTNAIIYFTLAIIIECVNWNFSWWGDGGSWRGMNTFDISAAHTDGYSVTYSRIKIYIFWLRRAWQCIALNSGILDAVVKLACASWHSQSKLLKFITSNSYCYCRMPLLTTLCCVHRTKNQSKVRYLLDTLAMESTATTRRTTFVGKL